VLSISPLRAGYVGADGAHQLLSTPELMIERGDRVALVGPNGSGKSTLLRTLIGEIPPLKGRSSFGTNVKTGYYAQATSGSPTTEPRSGSCSTPSRWVKRRPAPTSAGSCSRTTMSSNGSVPSPAANARGSLCLPAPAAGQLPHSGRADQPPRYPHPGNAGGDAPRL
jgi:energy-coupling factor transporter ATP-binding protein EcfA2